MKGRRLRPCLSFFRIRFLRGQQYRVAALAGVATQFFWGFMRLLAYRAFYRSDPAAIPMPLPQLAAYIWLQQAFLALLNTWSVDRDILEAITGGGIAYELCRPLDLYTHWLIRGCADRVSAALLRCLPILAVAALLPAPFRLGPPASLTAALLFPLSLALGTLLVSALTLLMYIAMFHTLSPYGVRMMVTALSEFLGGAVIPLPFLPERVWQGVELLPFASIQDLPMRIYGGGAVAGAAFGGVALQLFWLAVLLLLGRLWMGRTLRRVVVQGG